MYKDVVIHRFLYFQSYETEKTIFFGHVGVNVRCDKFLLARFIYYVYGTSGFEFVKKKYILYRVDAKTCTK